MSATDTFRRSPPRFFAPKPLVLAALASLLAPAPAAAQPPPADTLRELYANLGHCLGEARGQEGAAVTIVFSLRRDGSLLGRPRISYARLPGEREAQQRFLAGLGAALSRCLPVPVTPGLGGAIAGRPLTFHLFIGREAMLQPRCARHDERA